MKGAMTIVEDGVSGQKFKSVTCTLVWSVLAASIGSGFQHGYNTGVLNAPQQVIETWMNSTLHLEKSELTVIWSATTSIMCIGGIIGGALTSVLSNGIGRRLTLILNNGIAIVAGLIMGCSKYADRPWMLILGRLVIGINAGLNAGVSPMYLSEISPMGLRGAIGSMYQLVITISILIAQLVSISAVLGTATLWPVLLFIIIAPAVYQILALMISPESPKYLLEIDNSEKALSESVRLCGSEGANNLELVRKEIEDARSQPDVTMKDMLYVAKFRRPLIIMCLLMAAQQLSGINAVIYYSTSIFKTAQLSDQNAQIATVGVGVVNALTTVVSVFLVETVGRKPLLMIGFGGMTIDLSLFLVCLYMDQHQIMAYIAVILVYVFIVLFAIGAGSIPWIMGSELFSTAARPLGLSIAVPANWLFNFIVGQAFLPLQELMGPAVFVIFIISQALATVYFYIKIPETKNRPIEEITALFESYLVLRSTSTAAGILERICPNNYKKKSQNTHSKMTFTLIWTILAAAIGSGFQHGYNTGILNAPQKVIESWMNETMSVDDTELTIIWSTTTSIMSIGGIIGGALTSVASTSLGRRKALILNNLIAITAGILMGVAKYASQPWMLISGRFIVGINAGLNGGVAPMYLSEISPMRLRGSIGVVYQVSMTASILISEIVGNNAILGTKELWPFLLFLIIIPAIYQMIALLFSPESPKYLLEINEELKATSECIRLCGVEEGRENLERIKIELADAKSQPEVTFKDIWVIRKYRRPLIIMCLLHASQQLSGVNVVVYYSTQIFRSAHLSETNAQLATIGVGLINMLTTFVSLFLVEISGRKPLLTIGFGGMAVALGFLMGSLSYVDKYPAMAYAAVIIVYLFKVVFAIGPGPIPWLIGSELFTTSVRPMGLSVAVPVNWLCNFIVGLAFLPLQNVFGPSVFVIFIVFMAISAIYFFFAIPETKNRPIEEIAAKFEAYEKLTQQVQLQCEFKLRNRR
ncbi:hypothetical protein GE061_018059 [Apolygus lucorum]|uniref:Major facilitator superfamily (MFS) profile domain-containing protein n=1 Tax=Apolygus lucorum TaxID=248454 RepID=A0A8S9XCX1_APOLU|nr:hypothetical protein GE061_018059 [Apolygus lucorum]